MTHILAFDPGETTGWALYCTDSGTGETCKVSGEFPTWRLLHALIESYNPDVVVYEEFRLYPAMAKAKSFSTFPEVEVIGVLKYLCQQRGLTPVAQKASYKDQVEIPRRVDGVKGPHARDALRHAVYYVERNS